MNRNKVPPRARKHLAKKAKTVNSKSIKNSVKAANQLPSIDEQLNEVKHNLNKREYKYCLSLQWLAELNTLAIRYSHLNVMPDLANMSLPELWGVYIWLKGLGG